MAHELHFDCTMCGRCCRDLHLPLTLHEALTWIADGHDVEVLCVAMPWPVEPPAEHAESAYRRARSFFARSGLLRVRISVILAADLVGACPNLSADLRCVIHPRRPLVCRIYPYEINPFVALQPADKACPPEAWSTDRPLLQSDRGIVSETLQADVQAARKAALDGVGTRQLLCEELGLNTAAVVNEGYVIHPIDRSKLTEALQRALTSGAQAAPERHWDLVSDRPLTLDALAAVGAVGLPGPGLEARPYRYRSYRYLKALKMASQAAAAQPAGAQTAVKPSP
jgi:Fe-S-cluster containining protein